MPCLHFRQTFPADSRHYMPCRSQQTIIWSQHPLCEMLRTIRVIHWWLFILHAMLRPLQYPPLCSLQWPHQATLSRPRPTRDLRSHNLQCRLATTDPCSKPPPRILPNSYHMLKSVTLWKTSNLKKSISVTWLPVWGALWRTQVGSHGNYN